jgi:endonuclease G, mitochondrial
MDGKKTLNRFRFQSGIVFGLLCSLFFGYLAKGPNKPFYPKSVFILDRSGYSLAYDGRTKGAIWVYECLTPQSILNTKTIRHGFRFREDKEIPESLRASNEDFQGSGYDRGHLCPAADCIKNEEAMQDSFLLTNASPQVPILNRGTWKELERQLRQLALEGKTVHIYTLPLYLPIEIDKERYIHYRLIGEHDVAVPTHFAKVAFIDEDFTSVAYILPNHPSVQNTPLESFKTTVEEVERAAGVVFFRHSEPKP